MQFRETFLDKDTWDRFVKEQNCDYVSSNQDSPGFEIGPRMLRPGYLFSNGAFVSSDGTQYLNAPTDPIPLARMQCQYYEHLLEREEQNFAALNQRAEEAAHFSKRSSSVIPIGPGHIEALKEIELRVLDLHETLDELDAIIAEDKVEIAKQERADIESEVANERERLLEEVRQISIPSRR